MFKQTANITGQRMDRSKGIYCTDNLLKNTDKVNYGVREGMKDSWRERHNAKPVVFTRSH